MTLNNKELDRKADGYLSVLVSLPLVGVAASQYGGIHFWLVFWIVTAYNFGAFMICCGLDTYYDSLKKDVR